MAEVGSSRSCMYFPAECISFSNRYGGLFFSHAAYILGTSFPSIRWWWSSLSGFGLPSLEVCCCGAGYSLLQEEDFPEVCTFYEIYYVTCYPAVSFSVKNADVLEKVIRCKATWCDMRNRFLLAESLFRVAGCPHCTKMLSFALAPKHERT